MKLHIPLLASLLILPCFLLLQGQEAIMQYRLQEGTSYCLDIEIRQNTHSETVSREELNMYSHILLTFRTDSVSHSGSCYFSVSYSHLHLSVLSPALGLDIDSKGEGNRELSRLMDSLQHHSFSLGMSRWGELAYLDGLEEFFREMEADSTLNGPALNTMEEAYGPHAFENLFSLFLSYFPTVQPITNWTRDVIYYSNTKPVKMINRYQLSKIEEDELVVQGIGMINSMEPYKEVLTIGKVESSVSGSQTYDYGVDPESGWLHHCMSRQRLVIETRILESGSLPRNLKIPSYTETVFEVKGYPRNQEKP